MVEGQALKVNILNKKSEQKTSAAAGSILALTLVSWMQYDAHVEADTWKNLLSFPTRNLFGVLTKRVKSRGAVESL